MINRYNQVRGRWRHADPDLRRYTTAVTIASVGALVLYVLVLADFGPNPGRTALPSGDFSGFFDLQARRLLEGHLDIAPGDLGIEAFVEGSREYMYFPPGPALLRLPIVAFTDRFDGRLTAASMLLAWLVTTPLVAMTMWRIRRLLRATAPLRRGEAFGYGLLLLVTCGGSVLLYLAALPYVYHEVYAWAIACSLGVAYSLTGVLERPTTRGLLSAGAFTLGAILTRTTAGWACAAALLAAAVWFWAGRRRRPAPRFLVTGLLLAGSIPLAVGIAVNWAKFRHPYMFPLEDQVWTGINDHRRAALEANGGDLVSMRVLPSTVVNYLRPDGLRFTPVFPFITLPADIAPSYGGSFLDQTYRTGSLIAFMPLLVLLSIWGTITAFRPRGLHGVNLLRIPLVAMAAIPGAIMFYGYIAYRYTSEFVPVLVFASTIGYVDLMRRLPNGSAALRRSTTAGVLLLGSFGLVANLAVAVDTARSSRPGPPLLQYLRLQEVVSSVTPGDPLTDQIATAATLPRTGAAGRYQIVDDCHALYLGTGDPLAPWTMVEAKQLEWEIDLTDADLGGSRKRITLAGPDGGDRGLVLQTSPSRRYRLFVDVGQTVGEEVEPSGWRPIPGSGRIHLRLVVNLGLQEYAVVPGTSERGIFDFSAAALGSSGYRRMLVMRDRAGAPGADLPDGVRVTAVSTPELVACARLSARAGASPAPR